MRPTVRVADSRWDLISGSVVGEGIRPIADNADPFRAAIDRPRYSRISTESLGQDNVIQILDDSRCSKVDTNDDLRPMTTHFGDAGSAIWRLCMN